MLHKNPSLTFIEYIHTVHGTSHITAIAVVVWDESEHSMRVCVCVHSTACDATLLQ